MTFIFGGKEYEYLLSNGEERLAFVAVEAARITIEEIGALSFVTLYVGSHKIHGHGLSVQEAIDDMTIQARGLADELRTLTGVKQRERDLIEGLMQATITVADARDALDELDAEKAVRSL